MIYAVVTLVAVNVIGHQVLDPQNKKPLQRKPFPIGLSRSGGYAVCFRKIFLSEQIQCIYSTVLPPKEYFPSQNLD